MDTQALIVLTGLLVTVVWIITCMTGVVTGNFQGAEIVTPVMLIYAGFLFARGGLIQKKGDDHEHQ